MLRLRFVRLQHVNARSNWAAVKLASTLNGNLHNSVRTFLTLVPDIDNAAGWFPLTCEYPTSPIGSGIANAKHRQLGKHLEVQYVSYSSPLLGHCRDRPRYHSGWV